MHVGHFAVGEPHVLLLPTGLYYSVWWAGRSAGLVCIGLVLSYGLCVRGVSPGFGTKPEMPLGVATYCGYLQCGV